MPNYLDILSTNYAGKKWTLTGESYSGLNWFDETTKPTQAELDALSTSTQATIAAKEQATATAKASALAKLTALGLTQAEITALIG